MSPHIAAAREAMRSAFATRRALGIAREESVNIFDVAIALGVEVRFQDAPSLEGMFARDPHPLILLPSSRHRPLPRIRYSCAHELGHSQLGHGTHVAEYLDPRSGQRDRSAEEMAADTFATSLLMPRPAVLARFASHDCSVHSASPSQLFVIAGELGVGFTTLVRHLQYGLELISAASTTALLRSSPKQIRGELSGDPSAPPLTIVGRAWPSVPVDLEVGDLLGVPMGLDISGGGMINGPSSAEYTFLRAERPGEFRPTIGGRQVRARVARHGFVGQLKYRYLDDPEG
ncbi:MAG: ImmA/IrrE family metallo-endopeptidase [Phycisphaeraceae bacterium]|nr:ImmA/IrrE family metallo-endopeptidase [Phycisphaeraceae bacterium]